MAVPFLSSGSSNPHISPKENNPRDWNALIKHHTKIKNDYAILKTYTQMESLPDNTTLPLVLKACSRLNAVELGKKIHNRILDTNDLSQDVRVATALVDFYSKSGLVKDARNVFDEMSERDIVLWNAMLHGYASVCEYEEVVMLFGEMVRKGLEPNSRTVVLLLLAAGEVFEWSLGSEVHGYCLRRGMFFTEPHVGTALIGFYMKFNVEISCTVFDMMLVKNVVSWNAIITGCVEARKCMEALELFMQVLMEQVGFDSVTMLAVIQACAEYGCINLGMQIHQIVIKSKLCCDSFVVNSLINMYRNLGRVDFGYEVFKSIPTRDVAMWNSMILACVEFGSPDNAMSLFMQMQTQGDRPNERTIIAILSLCPDLADGLQVGKTLHAHIIKGGMNMDTFLGNAFLHMYKEMNRVAAVKNTFSQLSDVDVVSWNTLIAALAKSGLKVEAWNVFRQMQGSEVKPNSHTIISVLVLFADESSLNIARSLHGYVVKHGIEIDLPLNTALTEMYMNCGYEETGRNLFDRYSTKDIISWNSMIANYIRNNQAHKALLLFRNVIMEAEPNSATFVSILSSCIHLADLPLGRCIHGYLRRRMQTLDSDISLANSLLTMYARCGSLQNAEKIFKSLPRRDIISWNALITGYGMHGRGYEAKCCLSNILKDGLQPNSVTFVSVLSACSHSGLVNEGLQLFNSMLHDFNITPELIHYGCMVDLLGRGGYLDEALHFINSMPIEPDASLWRALLSACQVYSDIKLVKFIFGKLIELEPVNEGNYVLLSNIYASAGLWSEVRQVRRLLKEKGLKKPPGISWMVLRSQLHFFTAGDQSHADTDIIYANLNSLTCSAKDAGYVPNTLWLLLGDER